MVDTYIIKKTELTSRFSSISEEEVVNSCTLLYLLEIRGQSDISKIVCGDILHVKDQFINIDGMWMDAMDVSLPHNPRY